MVGVQLLIFEFKFQIFPSASNQESGQIPIIPKPESNGFWGHFPY